MYKNIYWSIVCIWRGEIITERKKKGRDGEGKKRVKDRNKERKEIQGKHVYLSIGNFNKMQCMHIMDYHINVKGMNLSYIY